MHAAFLFAVSFACAAGAGAGAVVVKVSLASAGRGGVAAWALSNGNGTIADVAAEVPGCVHTDLLAAGVIGEPNTGKNQLLQLWIASDNFTYSTRLRPFALPHQLLSKRNIDLVLTGLDTDVAVAFNGKNVLRAANMHRAFVLDAVGLARPSGNTLDVSFTGPVPASEAAQESCASLHGGLCADAACTCPAPWPGPAPHTLLINAFLRKEQQSFGWDFAPATGTSGITGAPLLVGYDSGLLRDVVVDTRPAATAGTPVPAATALAGVAWTVTVAVRVWSTHGCSSAASLTVTLGGGLDVTTTVGVVLGVGETARTVTLTVPASAGAKLWWPNGYGQQPLYPLTVTLDSAGEHQNKTLRVGFRTIEIEQPALPPGPCSLRCVALVSMFVPHTHCRTVLNHPLTGQNHPPVSQCG